MRDQGGEAFARPASTIPNGNYVSDQIGMSYRDWLVGEMVARWFERSTTASGKFYAVLAGDKDIRDVVASAHKVADIMIEERYK